MAEVHVKKLKLWRNIGVLANLAAAVGYLFIETGWYQIFMIGLHCGIATWLWVLITRDVNRMIADHARFKLLHGNLRHDD